MLYQPKIGKFSGQEDPTQWKAEFISEMEGPEGPGERLKHVYFSHCLEGAALEWYCHHLEYKAKVYWDLLSTAFDTRWKTTTSDVHTVEVLPNSKPPNFADDIRQQYMNYHIARQHRVAAHAQKLPTQTITTATSAIYETTTKPERLDRVADARRVSTPPTPVPTTAAPAPALTDLWRKIARKAAKTTCTSVRSNPNPI
jgi:hypothetical protein